MKKKYDLIVSFGGSCAEANLIEDTNTKFVQNYFDARKGNHIGYYLGPLPGLNVFSHN